MHRQRLPSVPPSPPTRNTYLEERPAVSDERIANKDCRAIGNAYTHGGCQAAGNREDEEEKADAIACLRGARRTGQIMAGAAN